MWKAKITAVSAVDSQGRFEVNYEIYRDDNVAYQNITAAGSSKEEVENLIKIKLEETIRTVNEAESFSVGDEIRLN